MVLVLIAINNSGMAIGTKEAKEKLAKKIQKLRKAAGLSQEELAEKIKISRTHMGHIEQARRSPSIKVMTKLANVLKVKIPDLF